MTIQWFAEGSHVLTPNGGNASVISCTPHGTGYQVLVHFAEIDPHQNELVLTGERNTFGSSELTLVSGNAIIKVPEPCHEENYLASIDD